LDVLRRGLHEDPLVRQADKRSLKVDRLINLLCLKFDDNGGGHRGIVFVEQVALVSSMAKILNDTFSRRGVWCGAVAGTGNQSEGERQKQLDKFKNGALQLIVSTAALEEGIDVSKCSFVVRYTAVATTKAHIQGAGRARHANAQIFYFENDPQKERQKEVALNTVAKDGSLSVKAEELQDAITLSKGPHNMRHPYPFGCRTAQSTNFQGEVNVYNCKQIFNQYCSIVLGASVQPKKMLYKFQLLPNGRKMLSNIRYPSPDGWQHVSYDEDFLPFWRQTDPTSNFTAERTKRKSTSDMEEMSFVYIVVVQLREQGYLNSHNQPVKAHRPETMRSCPLSADWSASIALKNRVFQSAD
jgi:Helicase conserved C-terminal domain